MYFFGLKDIIYDGTPPPAYQQNYIDHVSCLACVCVCVWAHTCLHMHECMCASTHVWDFPTHSHLPTYLTPEGVKSLKCNNSWTKWVNSNLFEDLLIGEWLGGVMSNHWKLNKSWTNQDNLIPFEDLWLVETPPLIDGCMDVWIDGVMSNHYKWNKFWPAWDNWFCVKIYDLWRLPHLWMDVWVDWWMNGWMFGVMSNH